jgi:competence protein ComEC
MELPTLLAAYAGGLLLAPFLFFAPWFPLLPLTAGGLWLAWRRRRLSLLLLLLFFCCLGIVRYQLQLQPPGDAGHIAAWVGEQPLRVEGRVTKVRSRPEGRSLVDIDTRALTVDGHRWPVRGTLRIFLDSPPGSVLPGSDLRLRGIIRTPHDFGTPGEFDYRRHLAREGIFATTHLASSDELAVLPGAHAGLDGTVQRWRLAAGGFIDRQLPPERAALARALLVGDQGGMSPDLHDRLSACGIAHLFAISGMHLGFIGGFLYLATLTLYRRRQNLLLRAPPRRVLPLALLPLLLFYLLFSGAALSTSRAFLVAAGGAVYLGLSRQLQPLRCLAAVAMLLLLLDPLALFEPGFQLSFAGSAGLLFFLPRWLPLVAGWHRLWRWLAALFLASLAASLSTLPLSLLHFHRFAPAAPLTNLWAVPLVAGAALPLGLAGLLLAPLAPLQSGWLLHFSGLAIHLALAGAEALTRWPLLAGRDWYPTPAVLAGLGLAVIALGLFGRSPRRRIGAAALALTGALLCVWPAKAPGALTVTALSVGQGESLLVTLPGGKQLLVDGGGSRNPQFDVGRRLVAPALGRLGVRSLAAVVLTHPHPDHYGGLREVLATFPVSELWTGPAPDALPPELVTLAAARGIPRRRFTPGWHALDLDSRATFALYAPDPEVPSVNDRSMVLYVRQEKLAALLTGDLEALGIKKLLGTPLPGPVNLLKIPHHGSRHSAPRLLLHTLHPKCAVVSVGAENGYGFPAPLLLNTCRRAGVSLWRTDRDGSVRFVAGVSRWFPQSWQNGVFR